MNRDEILDEYEALWRGAMVEDRAQGRGSAFGGKEGRGEPQYAGPDPSIPTCALLIYSLSPRRMEMDFPIRRWRCSEGCGFYGNSIGSVMAHLNNAHDWTWDMFANKFRDALAQGETS